MDQLLSPKTKRIAIVLLAVGLIALAGCNTGGSDATTTDPITNNTQTQTQTDEPLNSDVDFETLVSDHRDRIESADSFTSGIQYTIYQTSNGNTTTTANRVVTEFDFQESLALMNSSQIQQTQTQQAWREDVLYQVGNETYMRTNSSQIPQAIYNYGDAPYNQTEPGPVNFSTAGSVDSVYSSLNASLEADGRTDFEGQNVKKFRASGVDRLPKLTRTFNDSFANIDSINATFLVTDGGLITSMTYQLSGSTPNGGSLSVALQQSITEYDSTTVQEPAWIGEVNTTG